MPISHAIYLVANIQTAEEFLRTHLGFYVSADESTATGARFFTMTDREDASFQLQLVECDFLPTLTAKKRAADIVDFILDVADVHQLVNNLATAGITIFKQPEVTNYGITAIFEDPFGNLWDIVQRDGPKRRSKETV